MPHRAPSVEDRISRGHRIGNKTHGFDETHDPHTVTRFFFQDSDEGLVLFIIFYTQTCQWQRCLGCNLTSTASQGHVSFRSIMRQIDNLFAEPEIMRRADEITKIIASNQGSVLDEETFSTTALVYFVAQCNMYLPKLNVLSLESRPTYVDETELEILSRTLAEGDTPTLLEIAVGFEVFDDHLRNHVFFKGLTLNEFESMVKMLSRHGFHTKCYFMFKPVPMPHMTNAQAIKDVQEAIEYLSRLQDRIPGSVVSMHLNPTFAARGTPLETALNDGTWTPPLLKDVVTAVKHGKGRGVPIFIGLDDEGLAAEGGSFIRPRDTALVRKLSRFNVDQDFDAL